MTTQSTPLVMILASWVHLCFGISLFMNPDEVSRIAVVAGISTITEAGVPADLLGIFVALCASLSLLALIQEKKLGRWWAIALIFPQYTLLFIAFLSDSYILITGDVMGREVNFWVLIAVLCLIMGLAVAHTYAIFERYGHRWIQV